MIRCDLDPLDLVKAAKKAGLPSPEIHKTISSAQERFSDAYGQTVLDKALRWKDYHERRFAARYKPIFETICSQAVAQNSTAPMINQTVIDTAFHRTTVSRWLDVLCRRGALIKKPMGVRKTGMIRSNCYQLVAPVP